MPEPLIRILHLSDLAFDSKTAWEQDPLRAGLVARVARLRAEGLAPDVVAITGDITCNGVKQEFDAAATWLEQQLLPAAGLPVDRLLLVPGERDIDWGAISPSAATLHQGLLGWSQQQIANLLADPEERRPLLRRLKPWLAFANRLRGSREPLAVPWWQASIPVRGAKIAFAGLCSAWVASATDADKGRLLVAERQIQDLLPPRRGVALSVALVHHPLGWLHPVDGGVEKLLANRADLLLRGHDPEPSAATVTRHDRPLVELTAGAGTGHFSLIEVRAGEVRVHPFCDTDHGWDRHRNLADTPQGVIVLPRAAPARPEPAPAEAPAPRSAAILRPAPRLDPLPVDPFPVLAPCEHPATFGGRQRDLDDLLGVLRRERLIWTLYAPSGAGKSSLLRAGLLPALRGQTGASPRPVAFDALPAVPGIAGRLLEQLLVDPPRVADGDPLAFAAALARVRDEAGQAPLLVLDQLEDVFDAAALGWLGPLIAATAVAPGGRAARWVLVYREDFHGRVLGWLADLRAHPASADALREAGLPWDLSGEETSAAWRIPSLGEVRGAEDRLAAASDAFLDAIRRPLTLTDPDGQPLYPVRLDEAGARRLADTFAHSRLEHPGDPLTPELQVVLDRLIDGRTGTRSAPVALVVPEDPAALVSDAIGEHLRRKLAAVCDQGDPAGARGRRTEALLMLAQLVVDGRRRALPRSALLLDQARRAALVERLKHRGVWLLREELLDGVLCLTLPHDRVAFELQRLLSSPDELMRFGLDPEQVELWRLVEQRTSLWASGDRDAVVLDGTRVEALARRDETLPWTSASRAWWAEVRAVAGRRDRDDTAQRVRFTFADTGEPLRALHRLRAHHGLDGAALAEVLSPLRPERREEIFGLGPVGLREGEAVEILPGLVCALAPAARGAAEREGLYGGLLALVAGHLRPLHGRLLPRGRGQRVRQRDPARGDAVAVPDGAPCGEPGGVPALRPDSCEAGELPRRLAGAAGELVRGHGLRGLAGRRPARRGPVGGRRARGQRRLSKDGLLQRQRRGRAGEGRALRRNPAALRRPTAPCGRACCRRPRASARPRAHPRQHGLLVP